MVKHQGSTVPAYVIATVRKGYQGPDEDLGQKRYTKSEAESLAKALNEAYPGYRHRAAYVRGER